MSLGHPPDLEGVRHEYVQASGLRMHVALAGPDDAPPLVLVHGWPQHWWAWRNLIPRLAGEFRLIVPDLRGHGWTEAPRRGYDKEQLSRDLLGLLDALGIHRFTWIGHDWGAFTGFLAALREPARFERMLTMSIPHPWVKPDLRLIGVMLSYQGPLSTPLLGPRVADTLVRRILRVGRGNDPIRGRDVDLFAEHIPPAVSVAMYRTFITREVLPIQRGRYENATLSVPTTLLIGGRDLVTRGLRPGPVEGQPQLQVEVVPDVAHWIPEQRPEDIVAWVRRG